MNRLHLQPAPGRRVRHPDGRALAAAGECITPTLYWLRRLACGDVQRVPARPTESPADRERRRAGGKASS